MEWLWVDPTNRRDGVSIGGSRVVGVVRFHLRVPLNDSIYP